MVTLLGYLVEVRARREPEKRMCAKEITCGYRRTDCYREQPEEFPLDMVCKCSLGDFIVIVGDCVICAIV